MEMGNTPRPELRERNLDLLIARILEPLAHERLNLKFFSTIPMSSLRMRKARGRGDAGIKLAELVEELWALPPPETVTGSMARNAFLASSVGYPRASVFTPPSVLPNLLASGRS